MRRRNLELLLLVPAGLLTLPNHASLRGWWLPASFLAAHLILRFTRFTGSQLVLPLAALLTGASATLLTSFGSTRAFSYALGAEAGCALLVAAALWNGLAELAAFKYLLLAAAAILSGLLVTIGSGPAGTDARINLFGLFQPVEYVKLLAVLFLAGYFAGRDVELRRLHSFRVLGLSLPRWRDAAPVVIGFAAVLALFFLQRDLGPALILYLVFLGMFIAASRRWMLGLAGLAALIGVFWAVWRFRLLQTVDTRIEMWLSPWDNHRPGGLQLAESMWAMAAGGVFGRGPSATPQVIPAGFSDLILAAAGERFGLAGFLTILLAIAALFAVAVHHATRAKGAFARYLGLGIALLIGVQTVVIAGATVGLLPLTGVPVPFVSYGKSATVAYFLLAGLLLNLSGMPKREERQPAPWPVLAAAVAVLAALAAVGLKGADIMAREADELLARPALTPQADGVRRYSYNPRLEALAAGIPRGSILDRNGVPLALSRPGEARAWPLGEQAVHVLGHTRGYWTDTRTVEKQADLELRGYPVPEAVVLVDGQRALQRDLSALVPVFRDPDQLRALKSRVRDVHLTLDARIQTAAYHALSDHALSAQPERRGAAVVLDAATGAILASVSLPTYDPNNAAAEDVVRGLDRARFEVYPPGSTFKVVVAAAALESGTNLGEQVCHHTGEVEWSYQGAVHRRRVTDDESETAHGNIGLERALVESCNVYFAWAGVQTGADRLFQVAHERFGLRLKDVPRAADLEPNLPDNSYGQARITVTPMEMASVAAAIANGGLGVEPDLRREHLKTPHRILGESTAATLRDWMLEVVERGTGRSARAEGWTVGGKTGTAQAPDGGPSHSWFIGFAWPAAQGPEHALAFAFLIEHGGYGGRAAAGAAHAFLTEYANP